MNLLGIPLLDHTPAVCSNPYADCLNHGFGLSKERGRYIRQTIHDHAVSCVDGDSKTIDYARYMAGPPTLELETPAEIYAAGYLIAMHAEVMRRAEIPTTAASGLPPFLLEALKEATGASHIGVVELNVGKGIDTGRYSYSGNGHDIQIMLAQPTATDFVNKLVVSCTFPTSEAKLKPLVEGVLGVEATYFQRYTIQVSISKAFSPEQIADEVAKVLLDPFKS
jgi:hypothetical protein